MAQSDATIQQAHTTTETTTGTTAVIETGTEKTMTGTYQETTTDRDQNMADQEVATEDLDHHLLPIREDTTRLSTITNQAVYGLVD